MDKTKILGPHYSIASDSPAEAALVKSILADDFGHIEIHVQAPESPEPARADGSIVLLLAFKELAKSEHYYLSMYRHGNVGAGQPHRTVLLCTKEDATSAYRLCRGGLFDDYAVFWPISHDPKRLLMAVHRMTTELQGESGARPIAVEFAAQARRVAELEDLLAAQLRRGQEHIASTGRAVEQAEHEITTVLRALPAGAGASRSEAAGRPLRSINESLQPLKAWADNVMQAVSPQLESARELGALAQKMRQTVLIVDDNEFQRRIVGSILEAEGYEPLYAENGAQALEALQSVLPGLMLLDFQMPDVDGVEVIKQLKADPRLATVPVIMVSGNGEKDFVLASRQLGAIDFIVKPFNRTTLLTKVARVFSTAPVAGRA